MRGISASRVAALSQFTQALSPRIFPLYTRAHAFTRTPKCMRAHKHNHHLCHRRQHHLSPVAIAQTHTQRERSGGWGAHVLHHQTVSSVSSLGCQAESEQTDTDRSGDPQSKHTEQDLRRPVAKD